MGRFDNSVGVKVPRILFPDKSVDMGKWAVVACDQYTSEPQYWEETERIVGDSPSTLRLMLPEMYLDKPGEAERIDGINACMNEYVDSGVLRDIGEGFVYVKRTVLGRTRTGLIAALDLEAYDYTKGSKTLIRATEGTIVSRIPPRLRIRKDAPLEMPHILVLIDDPARTVIEPIGETTCDENKLYDFELMQSGGHVAGWFVNDEAEIDRVLKAMSALIDPDKFAAQYGEGEPPLLFAMGDGNHSFATAKANWENVKATLSPEQIADHPARFALVELENVHDEGIVFEPIHRVIFSVEPEEFLSKLLEKIGNDNHGASISYYKSYEQMRDDLGDTEPTDGAHRISFCTASNWGVISAYEPVAQLPVGTLQSALDELLKETDGASIDYVHGFDVVASLGSREGNIGFFLPPMDKAMLFPTVVFDGALPRKTFSMGEANEKRYYLECRRIK